MKFHLSDNVLLREDLLLHRFCKGSQIQLVNPNCKGVLSSASNKEEAKSNEILAPY